MLRSSRVSPLGLYRIYFLPIRLEPDFQTERNLMCKMLRTYVRVIWVFDYFFRAADNVTSFTLTHNPFVNKIPKSI